MLKLCPPLFAALILATGPALAQQQAQCAPYETVAAALASEYHEAPVARMLAEQGFAIEVLAAADGSTFSILGIQPSGTACMLATGSAFAFVNSAAEPKPGTGS